MEIGELIRGRCRVKIRGGESGRFCELNSQKIFSKTKFRRKYLGKLFGLGTFANQNSIRM